MIPIAIGILVAWSAWNFDIGSKLEEPHALILTYSTLLLGFLLASYGIIFGSFSNLPKNLIKSDQFKKINNYFFVSILLAILQVIISFVLIVETSNPVILSTAFLVGTTLGMVYYISFGIKSIFLILLNQS